MVCLDLRLLQYSINPQAIVRPRQIIPKASEDSFDLSSSFLCGTFPKDSVNQDSLLRAGAIITSSGTHINIGNHLMMISLVFQVVTLGVFSALAADIYFRIRKYHGELNDSTKELRSSGRFKCFLIATIIAYTCISIRCVYRIAEIAGGWRNKFCRTSPRVLYWIV